MAIVQEGVAPNGARFYISDAAYVNCTPEEIERRRRHSCDVAYRILVSVARKRIEQERRAQEVTGEDQNKEEDRK